MLHSWMIKNRNGYELWLLHGFTGVVKTDIISYLNQKDFDFMMEHFQIMLRQEDIEVLPYYYIFPRQGVRLVEVQIQLVKHKDLHYSLDLNLGSVCLSEMTQLDFQELIQDLTMLQTREDYSKVYFPVVTNESNTSKQHTRNTDSSNVGRD